MIKVILLCLYVYGVALSSHVSSSISTIDNMEYEADIVDALEPLPGTCNLNEKRVPLLRLTIPARYPGQFYGTKNLVERSQLSFHYISRILLLPGVKNLQQKALPKDIIETLNVSENTYFYNTKHPKSEVEKVVD